MTGAPVRAVKNRRHVKVYPRANGGRDLYRKITRKKDPLKIENLTDQELLRVILPEQAAQNVAQYLEPHGGLRGFAKLGEGGPRNLLALAGVDEASAARLLVLWELAARISEPYREG